MFKIVPKFSQADIRKIVAAKMEKINAVIMSQLTFIWEKSVRNARNDGGYTDQTGNLRGSIGYVILKDGRQVNENYEERGGPDGVKNAKKVIRIARKNTLSKGWVTIVVAGMEYAAAMESKGKDVLTASSITAERDLRRAIAEISSRISC